jgi:signal-transduction protein with cAMP-binding, CBS, and nucleotidyltransferase domain
MPEGEAMKDRAYFAFLEPAEEAALLDAAALKTFQRDEIIVAENVSLRALYVIEHGSVKIERENGPTMVPLAILARGEMFGEMSFVDSARTSARVVAREPTQVRIIDTGLLDRFEETDPTFSSRLYRSLAAILVERLRTTSLNRYV